MAFRRLLRVLGLTLSALVLTATSRAQQPALDLVELNISPLTLHFTASSEHKNVGLLGISKVDADGTIVSGAVFSNSFGQPCVTVQWGRRYLAPFGEDRWYWQWTVGPVYGYVAPYNHKVPLNYKGLSPVVIPSLGYQLSKKFSAQFTLLGNSALMLQLAYQLPDR
jgi:hypothetical protein